MALSTAGADSIFRYDRQAIGLIYASTDIPWRDRSGFTPDSPLFHASYSYHRKKLPEASYEEGHTV